MHTKKQPAGTIVALWMQTARLMRERMLQGETARKTNPLQLFALYIIADKKGITMKEFAEQLCITSPSATALADRLVKIKWIDRSSDPKNRRMVRLLAAPKGKKILAAAMRQQENAMKNILLLLPAKDRRDFARILHRLHTVLLHTSSH